MKKIIDNFLSEAFRETLERVIIWIAILSFLLHLLLIFLLNENIIQLNSKLTVNPISAIYTPFSFILVYEVFLLVFYLPRSISSYIGKQYEIITLIVIRRIFKDIGYMKLSDDWFKLGHDLQITYDLATAVILFFLIQKFYKNLEKKETSGIVKIMEDIAKKRMDKFIQFKKTIAAFLVPVVIILAFYSLINWLITCGKTDLGDVANFKNINNIFFEDFFILLIIIDVILLLFSFFYSDSFHKIIRNSGFVISTILIKLSFSVEGAINNALILGAVIFGFLILIIHNSYKSATEYDL
ncbi:hypothetical protein [Halpernia frigidisoli]|uniref:Uncharacterized protein n=1 Tax=Halpernia frigidisoli TaxID=1125876 RepID=A0A1I3F983_9FLAO|nr:hypothetical protein [Halpernia frigidisoli]SFI07804.1 hypothetical protein SAMN05443292_1232 [Halpernia frigidisoli]